MAILSNAVKVNRNQQEVMSGFMQMTMNNKKGGLNALLKFCFQNFGHLLFPKVDRAKFALSYKKEESSKDYCSLNIVLTDSPSTLSL